MPSLLSGQALSFTGAALKLRSAEFYSSHGIEVQLDREATSVDLAGKTVTFASGEPQSYDTLLLATGSK